MQGRRRGRQRPQSMLHKPLSLASSQREGSGSEGPVTYLGHTARGARALSTVATAPTPWGRARPRDPGGSGSPGAPLGVPNSAVAGTGLDTPTAPLEGAHGAGESQGLSISATPAPGLSCALAPILPRQHSYFYSLQFSVGSPCVCVAGGGGAGNGTARGVGRAGGAHWATGVAEGPQCPSKGRLPPAPRRPPCPLPGGPAEMHSAKAARVTRPHSVFELVCETRCQPLLHPHRWEKGMAQFRHWGNDIPW